MESEAFCSGEILLLIMKKTRIGIVGCGNISGIYLKSPAKFANLEIAAVADVVADLAKAKAEEYQIPKVYSPEELYKDPSIEIVVNLTPPAHHAAVALAALENGKSVYTEKPLAVTREDGRKVLELAKKKGLRVGCAPDTFLGAGLQTCRKIIDDGWIGTPVAATAFMLSHGPEGWHPNPEFFYKQGGGPMFDMGPYYLTALCHLMGPVRRVTGSARITFPERTATSAARYGQKIPVETATHVAGVLDFQQGAVATLVTSFDVWSHQLPNIEIYGSHGSLRVPDPNTFGGPILLRRAGAKEWSEVPVSFPHHENSRGLGVADMAAAIEANRPHRASGELAYHVLDLMHAFHDASKEGRHLDVESTCAQPAPFPMGLLEGQVD